MNKEKKFKVSKALKEYVRNILAREGIHHHFREEDGQLFCFASISGEKFHKAVKRAYCEKKTDETGILHLTYAESQDINLSYGLMKLFKKSSFIVVGNEKTTK